MYHQSNIYTFHVLLPYCVYVFCMDLRTNSDYFPVQHLLIGFFISEMESVYCAVRAERFSIQYFRLILVFKGLYVFV